MTRLLAIPLVALLVSSAAPPLDLPAQDPDSAALDSTDTAEAAPLPRRPGEPNPYLREVREQPPPPHPRTLRGPVWSSFALGAGGEGFRPSAPGYQYTSAQVRPTLTVAAGVTAGQHLRIGAQAFGWANIRDGALESITTLMAAAQFYPSATSGLHLRAAGGIGRYGLDFGDCCAVRDIGLSWSAGIGLEERVGGRRTVGIFADWVHLSVPGVDGYRERILNVGISITIDGPDHDPEVDEGVDTAVGVMDLLSD